MERKKILEILTGSRLFHGLREEEIERLLQNANYKILEYKKNKIYTLEGASCLHADLVLKGRIVSYMIGSSGKSVLMGKISEGGMIAPAFIFAENHAMPVTVKADMPTTIIRFNPTDLMHMIDREETVRHNFIIIISNIVTHLTDKIHMLNMLTAKGKLAAFLIEKYKQQQSNVIKLDCSRQELADQFGIQKYSLSRAFTQLAEAKIIEINGRMITITDPKVLFTI